MAGAGRKRDYYEVLGLARDASAIELKRAFRERALRWHPDKNPGDLEAEERFKELNEAYAILSDEDKRAAYDRFGHAAFGAPGAGGVAAGAAGFAGSVADVVEGLFGDLLGRRGRRSGGRDLRYTLEVEFAEAAMGTTRTIRFPTRKDCGACGGTGARSGAGLAACQACGGRGEVRIKQGFFTLGKACGACEGTGRVVIDPCSACGGSGLVRLEREFTVRIPPGTEDGAVKMVRGEGEPGRRGGPPGDLHVVVRVGDHPLFTRSGHDVVCEVPISFPQAALGAQVDVPTLEGKVRMRVPSGTQSGRVFRLRGKGIPRGEGGARGDQHVRVVVETPTELTPRQRELLEQLAREGGDAVAHPRKRNFLEKVRELFGA
jgi:molecular chaperone DnaJ